MKYKNLAVDYFERHSTSQECHITSDGRVFHTNGHAISFASEHNLQDQTIESYKREQVATVAENATVENFEDVENSEEKQDGNDTDVETNEDAGENEVVDSKIEELKSFDIETGDYQDVKSFIKHFNIETADQKADTLKTALTEFKNNLAQ
ncbi:hypothetical protein [Epilithonimonas xixisoli]|uniref:Uncharacterized protein n=1 Tax=Epilithonimonas xixisoli TaxID=1476462 RepID=A0A4V6QBR7_9FLAO|nr:hypothetical protein [Epilithonimonas xixisoli]TDX86181.1 hypothetical protein B0I22_0291 [Epilithonimonas xixisoli]